MKQKTPLLHILPEDIILWILTEWINCAQFQQFDTALTNRVLREQYLSWKKKVSWCPSFTLTADGVKDFLAWKSNRNISLMKLAAKKSWKVLCAPFPYNEFQTLKSLKLIRENAASHLDTSELLSSLPNLEDLHLSATKLSFKLTKNKKRLKQNLLLKKLTLEYGRRETAADFGDFSTVVEYIAPFCPQLEYLELSGNRMSWEQWCTTIFIHLPVLEEVYLRHCLLSNVDKTLSTHNTNTAINITTTMLPLYVFPQVKKVKLTETINDLKFLLCFPNLQHLSRSLYSSSSDTLPCQFSYFEQMQSLHLTTKMPIVPMGYPTVMMQLRQIDLDNTLLLENAAITFIRSLYCVEDVKWGHSAFEKGAGVIERILMTLYETALQRPQLQKSLQHLSMFLSNSLSADPIIFMLGSFRWKALKLNNVSENVSGRVWEYLMTEYPHPECLETFHYSNNQNQNKSIMTNEESMSCNRITAWRFHNVMDLTLSYLPLSDPLYAALENHRIKHGKLKSFNIAHTFFPKQAILRVTRQVFSSSYHYHQDTLTIRRSELFQ